MPCPECAHCVEKEIKLLKGCPFCGTVNNLTIDVEDDYWFVKCEDCSARGPNDWQRQEAINIWNGARENGK